MEESSEGGLDHVRNIQLMIILNNQEIKANEQYIFYKKVEIEKLSAKYDEHNKETATLEEKYLSLTSRKIQSENSLSISNECLKAMSDHIIAKQREKEEQERHAETLKNKYADAINKYNDEYEKMKKEYEENTPGYKQLKELQYKNTDLEAEIKVLEDNIETEKQIRKTSNEMKKREFYNAIVQFAKTVLSYKKNVKNFMLCKQLAKEEIQLLRKYSELDKQNLFKRSCFAVPKVPPPLQLPKFQPPPISRALLNASPMMSPRKYSLLENEKSNYKEVIDGMKRRRLNSPAKQKPLSQSDSSPYFQNSISQKVHKQNNQEGDSTKTSNKNHGKVKVIDVTVIPQSPVTFNNTATLNKNQSTNNNNNTFIEKPLRVPHPSYNSNNNERGQFRDPKIKFDNNQPKINSLIDLNKDSIRSIQNKNIYPHQKPIMSQENEPRNSQEFFFSQESVTDQFKNSQTGLTPEMLQFKLPSRNNQISNDENKENDETSHGQETERQPFVYNEGNCVRSLNNSFNNEPNFSFQNANNSSIFGQFDRSNEIPHVQLEDASNQLNGIEMQYMDTENENFICSPINSFLLNTMDTKEDNKDENKNKQSSNFFFKFGESTSNNGSSGQRKLFDMYY